MQKDYKLHLLKVALIVLHALCSSLFYVHDASCDHCRRSSLHFFIMFVLRSSNVFGLDRKLLTLNSPYCWKLADFLHRKKDEFYVLKKMIFFSMLDQIM